eukprot:TRINITY_DN3424_c0_g1_i8.p1 TRINITY_DN3424_c0_g1~~TRINITY_DN3424_c0_g1_i8.p1  ORF type:complete len:427 (+),score=37.48 TRINITY_DN3424_c0_g1_i8:78-1283(+)
MEGIQVSQGTTPPTDYISRIWKSVHDGIARHPVITATVAGVGAVVGVLVIRKIQRTVRTSVGPLEEDPRPASKWDDEWAKNAVATTSATEEDTHSTRLPPADTLRQNFTLASIAIPGQPKAPYIQQSVPDAPGDFALYVVTGPRVTVGEADGAWLIKTYGPGKGKDWIPVGWITTCPLCTKKAEHGCLTFGHFFDTDNDNTSFFVPKVWCLSCLRIIFAAHSVPLPAEVRGRETQPLKHAVRQSRIASFDGSANSLPTSGGDGCCGGGGSGECACQGPRDQGAGGGADAVATLTPQLAQRIKRATRQASRMLFMKGSKDKPRCKYSRRMVNLLNKLNVKYDTFVSLSLYILEDDEVRQCLKIYSGQKTYPQLFYHGELVGGIDIVESMQEEGTLLSRLGME